MKRAIILAAGEGSRLRPLTEDRPKCLVAYQGRPLISYQIEAMRECGIEDIIVVGGYRADQLESLKGVRLVLNREYDRTNMVYTFFCARDFFDCDVIVSYGDILFGRGILEAVLKQREPFSMAVSMNWRELWSRRMEDPLQDAETLKLDNKGYVTELGKKPRSYDEIEGQYMGLFKISRSRLEVCRQIYDQLDRTALYDGKDFANMYMTSFIQVLIDRGHSVKSVPVHDEWLEVDSPDDLEVACDLGQAKR